MIRVVIADRWWQFRLGLAECLSRCPGIEVVGDTGRAAEVPDLCRRVVAEVLILDISLPDLPRQTVTAAMGALPQVTRVIGVSEYRDEPFVTHLLRSGAKGYLLRDRALDEAAEAVAAVAEGRIYLSPDVADLVVQWFVFKTVEMSSPSLAALSDRERSVLRLVAEGRTTTEMAACLGVATEAIESDRASIMEKLNLYSVAALTKCAVRLGLTSLDQ